MPKDWTDSDTQNLRNFMKASPFIETLRKLLPKITSVGTLEARAMSGSERKGSDDMIEIIEGLAEGSAPNPDASNFIDDRK